MRFHLLNVATTYFLFSFTEGIEIPQQKCVVVAYLIYIILYNKIKIKCWIHPAVNVNLL